MAVLRGQSFALDLLFERTTVSIFNNCLYRLLEGGIVLLMRQARSLTIGICESQPLTILILERIDGNINYSLWIERWLFTWPWVSWVSPSVRRVRLVLYWVHDFVRFASQSND